MKYDKDIRICRWILTALTFSLMLAACAEARAGQWLNVIVTALWTSSCVMARSSCRSQQKTRDELRITGALIMEQLRREQDSMRDQWRNEARGELN